MIDVAIVGAGPTGLALANLLGAAGLAVTLIERNAATASEPRAVILDDESMRAFQAMGLADTLLPLLREGRATRYFAHPRARTPFAEVDPQGREYGWPKRLRLHQPDLERVLQGGLARYPAVTVCYDTAVAGVDVAADHATARLEGGGSVVARRLVACDGGASPIRRALGIATTGDSYEEPWLVVDLIDDPFDPGHSMIVCDPRRPAVSIPGPGRRRRFEFMILHGEERETFLDDAVIARLLADYGYGPVCPPTIARKTIYVFHARAATRWRHGPVLLAGDAAHLMPPFMGQGLNSCVRDAWNLSWKLVLAARGVGGDALLDSYEAERRPHVERMIHTSVTVAELAMTTSRPRAMLRNALFRLARLSPRVKRHINGQFFKPKPQLETGLFIGPPPAGRMLPQPLLPGGARLDDAIGPGFGLIGVDCLPPPHPLWVALGARSLSVAAADAPALAEHAGHVLLLRPDRVVTARFAPAGTAATAARFGELIAWRPKLAEAAE